MLGSVVCAQTAEVFKSTLVTRPGGHVFLSTPTQKGRGYRTQFSDNLTTWTPLETVPVYGSGERWLRYVVSAAPAGGAVSSLPDGRVRADFRAQPISDGRSLVSFMLEGGVARQRVVDLDFRTKPAYAGGQTSTHRISCVTLAPVLYDPSMAALQQVVLTAGEQAALAALEAIFPQLSATVETLGPNAEAAPSNRRRYWRVVEERMDSDGDSVFDDDEIAAGLDPYLQDTDRDKVSDAAERTAGTDAADFFNGAQPTLEVVSGDLQIDAPERWLEQPLVVQVKKAADGSKLVGAPVSFMSYKGGAKMSAVEPRNAAGEVLITVRTDAEGQARVWLQLPTAIDKSTTVLAAATYGAGSRQAALKTFTAYPGYSLNPAASRIASWLRADRGVTLSAGTSLVEKWEAPPTATTGRSAAANGALRPTWQLVGGKPALSFAGTQALDFGTPVTSGPFAVLAVAQPTATRTIHTVSNEQSATELAFTGQNYLLAGNQVAGNSPYEVTPAVAEIFRETHYFSSYVQKYIVTTNGVRNYQALDLSFKRAGATIDVRYDVTPNAIVGNPTSSARIKRTNPNLAGVPLVSGQSLDDITVAFATIYNTSYEWRRTKQGADFTFVVPTAAGNVDAFTESYYKLDGYTPGRPASTALNVGAIGSVGVGISLGTNSMGIYALRDFFKAPRFYTGPPPAALSLMHVAVDGSSVSGRFDSGAPGVQPYNGPSSFSGPRSIGAFVFGSGAALSALSGYQGHMSELLITNGNLPDAERYQLEDGMNLRWALPALDRDADGLPDHWEHTAFNQLTKTAATDEDGDGLTQAQEASLAKRTHPLLKDSDGDGLSDGAERTPAAGGTATDPVTPDGDGDGWPDAADARPLDAANGRADADGNGWPDGVDYLIKRPQTLADSDADGLPDVSEFFLKTNLQNRDTDGDGLPDGWEVDYALKPGENSGEHGAAGDPDRDGASNLKEFLDGTDPRDSRSVK